MIVTPFIYIVFLHLQHIARVCTVGLSDTLCESMALVVSLMVLWKDPFLGVNLGRFQTALQRRLSFSYKQANRLQLN